MGKNLEVLPKFNVGEFYQELEESALKSTATFSIVNREMLLACQAQMDSAVFKPSVQLPQIFARWLKDSTDLQQGRDLVLRSKVCWNTNSPISSFEKLCEDSTFKDVPVHLLWTLALATVAETSAQGLAAYECWKICRENVDVTVKQKIAARFVEELGKSRLDLASKVLEEVKRGDLKAATIHLLNRKSGAANERGEAVKTVVKMLGDLTVSYASLAAEVLAAIPQRTLSCQQEADLLLQSLSQCKDIVQLEAIFSFVKNSCSRLLQYNLNKKQLTSSYSLESTFTHLFDEMMARGEEELIEDILLLISKFNWTGKGDILSDFLLKVIDKYIDAGNVDKAKKLWKLAIETDVLSNTLSETYQTLLEKFLVKGVFGQVIDDWINQKRFRKEQADFLLAVIKSDVFTKFFDQDPKSAIAKLQRSIAKLLAVDQAQCVLDACTLFKANSSQLTRLLIAFLFIKVSKPSDSLKSLIKGNADQLINVLVQENQVESVRLFLKIVLKYFSKQELGKSFADALHSLMQNRGDQLPLETVLAIYEFSGSVKAHLSEDDYQEFLDLCYAGLVRIESKQPMDMVLDVLIKMNCRSGEKWNKWFAKIHQDCNRQLMKKSAEHLLSHKCLLNPTWKLEGNRQDIGMMVVYAVDAQQKANNYACLDLLESLPQLRRHFEERSDLEKQMLDKLFEGTDKALQVEGTPKRWFTEVEAAKQATERLAHIALPANTRILVIEGASTSSILVAAGGSPSALVIETNPPSSNPRGRFSSDSSLTLGKLLESKPTCEDIIDALQELDLKNISVRILKSPDMINLLQQDGVEALKALRVLYDKDQAKSSPTLTDGILYAVCELLNRHVDIELTSWLKPILKRLNGDIGKKSELRAPLMALFNRLIKAAISLNDPHVGAQLLKVYLKFTKENPNSLKLNEDNLRSSIKIVKELMERGFEQDAEDLLPSLVAFSDSTDPIWQETTVCSETAAWIEKWLKHGLLCDSQAVTNPKNLNQLKSIFSFVCRLPNLPSTLYIQVLTKMDPCEDKKLAQHVWQEGWQQALDQVDKEVDEMGKAYKAARFNSLTTYATTHYPEGLRELVKHPRPWCEFITSGLVSYLERSRSIDRLLSLVLKAVINHKTETSDAFANLQVVLIDIEDFFENAMLDLQSQTEKDALQVLAALTQSVKSYEFLKIIIGCQFKKEDGYENLRKEIRSWASQDGALVEYNNRCDCLYINFEVIPEEFQQVFLEEVVLGLSPKMKKMIKLPEDAPEAFERLLKAYVCLVSDEDACVNFINDLRIGVTGLFEGVVFNGLISYLTYTNRGRLKPEAHEIQTRILGKVAKSSIGTLQNDALCEMALHRSTLPKDLSRNDLIEAYDHFIEDSKEKKLSEKQARLIEKMSIKHVFYIAHAINMCCSEKSTLRSEWIGKAIKLIEGYKNSLASYRGLYPADINNDLMWFIENNELECLEQAFFDLILPLNDPDLKEIEICRAMLDFVKSDLAADLPKHIFDAYINKIARKLITILVTHLKEETFERAMECLDAFLFHSFPFESREEGFAHTVQLMKVAFNQKVFKKDPLRFFQYTYLCPLSTYNPEDEQQQILSSQQLVEACESAVTRLLDNPYLSRIPEANRYIEIAGQDGVPPHLKLIGTTSGPIVEMKKKLEKLRKRAFLSNPQKYFELWSKVYSSYNQLVEGPLVKLEMFMKKEKLTSLFDSRFLFLKECILSGAFKDKYVKGLTFIDQQCEILKADPKLFFDAYASKMTLLYLMKTQEANLTDEEKAAKRLSFNSWLTYLSENQHPKAKDYYQMAVTLAASSKLFED